MSDQFKERVRSFYDDSAELWVAIWGEHMHHGFYPPGEGKIKRQDAQSNLVNALIEKGSVESAKRVLDVGCGVGGSARVLAQRYGSDVLGLTLSPAQKRLADQLNDEVGLNDTVEVQVRDVLSLGTEDGIFDLIWCVECLEHIKRKAEVFQLLSSIQEPGGRLLMTTWCLTQSDDELDIPQQRLLQKVYRSFNWSPLDTFSGLEQGLADAGYTNIEFDDWSPSVAPFWTAVRRSALDVRNARYLHKLKWSVVKGAFDLRFLQKAYDASLIKYVAISCSQSNLD